MAEIDIADAGALFQIEEPDANARRAPRRTAGRAVGIDLGTTHSLVAAAPSGARPQVLEDRAGEGSSESRLLPSVVYYPENGGSQVGRSARVMSVAEPKRVIASVKRLMGRGMADVDFATPYDLAEPPNKSLRVALPGPAGGEPEFISPMEVSAEILVRLRERAEDALGHDVEGAVITVPAYFDEAQRQATRDAGRLAGLDVYRLLAEPTAAALAYGLDRKEGGLFAVYDLGGGTFDISILRLDRGVFQVLATGGDSALGGDDFDRALVAAWQRDHGVESLEASVLGAALVEARRVKEALSEADACEYEVQGSSLRGTTSREGFEREIRSLVRRTIRACKRTLEDAELEGETLDEVVLVGGSTRVPAVRAAVEAWAAREPLCSLDPDEVVALGAAVSADILSGSEREGVTLLDVVPLSLGLETMGGLVEVLIPRNATIPIAARQVFTNYSEQQTGMSIHVVQGERELAEHCRSLARFELKGIPRLPPSMARVEVSFELDADALLTVSARELMTGVRQTIEVKPSYGLSEAEVETLVAQSLDHAREDFEARNLAEARVELGRVVLAVRKTLAEVGGIEGFIAQEERLSIDEAITQAEAAMAKEADADSLEQVRKGLEKLTEPLARRRMERALNAGMSGKSLHEIESSLADEDSLDQRRGGHAPEAIRNDSDDSVPEN